jgi:hypothetical protein
MPLEVSRIALVVEDDADTRANLQDILELDEWQVETASSVREVLQRDKWDTLSIVILDRLLPDGNAEALLPIIRERAPHAAAIIVTGYADLDDAISALRQGAADYLLKPVNPDALRASMARLLEQRRTTEELTQSQQRLQEERDFAERLIATVQTMVLVLDTQHRIIRFNPYLASVTGFELSEVQGLDWIELAVPPHLREERRRVFAELIADGQSHEFSGAIITKSRTIRSIEWSAKALVDAHGETIGLLASGRDVTSLKVAQERALQAERLAAIGQMMAGLAHESRNALQRSQACLEMLAADVEDRPQALEMVSRIQRAQRDLQTLHEEVRQYAAPITLDRETTDLAQLARETWSQLTHARRGKEIVLRIETHGVNACCDVDRFTLGQVWRNILENAIQVSPERAEISIECAEVCRNGREAVQVSFRDQGPGMSADQRNRIFEPFFTTKAKGTGLGMAIAQRIVASHNGSIDAAERDGPGAEIIVVLPRCP